MEAGTDQTYVQQFVTTGGTLPSLQGLGFDSMNLEDGVKRVNIAQRGFDPYSARSIDKEALRGVLTTYMDTAWIPKQANPYLPLLEVSNVSRVEISTPASSVILPHKGNVLLWWAKSTGGITIESLARDNRAHLGYHRSRKDACLIEIPEGPESYFYVYLTPLSKPDFAKAHSRLKISFDDTAITHYGPINEVIPKQHDSGDPFYSDLATKQIGTTWNAIWREAGFPGASTARDGKIQDFGAGITFNYRDGHSYKELVATFEEVMSGELLSQMVRGIPCVNPQSLDGSWIGESGGHFSGCYLDIQKAGRKFTVHTDTAEAMFRLIVQMRTIAALHRNIL
jgi:hypothetical protein